MKRRNLFSWVWSWLLQQVQHHLLLFIPFRNSVCSLIKTYIIWRNWLFNLLKESPLKKCRDPKCQMTNCHFFQVLYVFHGWFLHRVGHRNQCVEMLVTCLGSIWFFFFFTTNEKLWFALRVVQQYTCGPEIRFHADFLLQHLNVFLEMYKIYTFRFSALKCHCASFLTK